MPDRITYPLSEIRSNVETHKRLTALHLGSGGVIEPRRIDRLMELVAERGEKPGIFPLSDIDPLPQLVVQNPAFSAEAFDTNGALLYVSRRMRAMLPFTEDEVQYLPVDDSLSLPQVRAQAFSILYPLVTEDIADPVRSKRRWDDAVPWTDTPPFQRPTPPFDEIVVRQDFQPRARIFKIHGLPVVTGPFVTADAAKQVEGLPDIGLYPAHRIRYP